MRETRKMCESKKELTIILQSVGKYEWRSVTMNTDKPENKYMNPNSNKTLRTKPVFQFSALLALAICLCTFANEQGVDLTDKSLEELMNIPVVSTATLTVTKPRLVPAAVTTITEEQIKASGARSLFELLDIYVPNLQWIRHHWESDHLGLRGIISDRDDKYLLLVNGRIINERTHFGALTERDLALLRDIHHIDVIRGPGSALYGPGAVSMVINIVTHNANTFKGTEFTGRLGAVEEFYTGEMKHGQAFDDNDGGLFIYTGIGKYVGASKYDAPLVFPYTFPDGSYEAGDSYTDAPLSRDGAAFRNKPPEKIHIQLTRDNWDIWGRYTRGGQQFTWAPILLVPAPVGYPASPRTNNSWGYQQITGYIGYKQELSNDIDIDYAFSYETTDFAEFRQNGITNAYREDEYFTKVLLQWHPNGNHQIAFGPEFFHRELGFRKRGWPDDPAVSQRLDPMPRWSTDLYSLLGEWQWNINDRWTTFLGGRIDDHTFTNEMFSPRAAIVYTPNEKDTYKLMWSRSVRANFEEEMKAQSINTGINTNAPEKLDSVELRYERKQTENLDLAASFFLHYNLELISWNQSIGNSTNVGTQKDYGIELEASYHTEKTRVIFSHSYTKLYDFKLNDPASTTYVTAEPYGFGDDLAQWSNHITKVTAQHKLNDKWTLDASMRIYWGFPGMKDYDNYYPYGADGTTRLVENGWEKAYRGNYYLNLGLQYKPSDDLTIGLTGYYLLGIFDKDLNKRNFIDSSGDYRSHAPAVGVYVEYKF